MDTFKVAVDAVVFGYSENNLQVLLIKRGIEPFLNSWALPGGFVRGTETFEEAVIRELDEEAGIRDVYLEQLYSFSEVDRDPRGRVISISHYCLVSPESHNIQASTDAESVAWFPIKELPSLAFDHKKIIDVAYTRLKNKIVYQPIGFELMPKVFTFKQLRTLYEVILDKKLHRVNFQKKMKSLNFLNEVGAKSQDPKALKFFEFDEIKYNQLKENGLYFEIKSNLKNN